MQILKRSKKMYQVRKDGFSQIRVWLRRSHKKGQMTVLPRLLLKCGCCNPSKSEFTPSGELKIYFDEDSLEINGVNGSLEDWREILLPLLDLNQKALRKKSL